MSRFGHAPLRHLWFAAGSALVLAACGDGNDSAPFSAEGTSNQFWTDEVLEQSYHLARERVIASFERRYLTWLVNRAAGNMSKAARLAGVDRTTLYRLMERHGLQRETITVAPE